MTTTDPLHRVDPFTRRLVLDIAHTCPDLTLPEVVAGLVKQAQADPDTITSATLRRVALEWIFGARRDF